MRRRSHVIAAERVNRAWPRPLELALSAAIALLALALATAAQAQHPKAGAAAIKVSCRPARGTTTIAHSAKARIFSDARTGNDYACLYSNGRPHVLSTTEHWEYEMVRFKGAYVAFVAFAEATNKEIGVLNMRTGRRHDFHEYEEVAPVEPPPGECPSGIPNCKVICPEVNALVLKPDGALAWIATDFSAPVPGGTNGCGTSIPPTIEVRRFDSRGLKVLDSGGGIAPHSLRLAGSTLYWTDKEATLTSSLL